MQFSEYKKSESPPKIWTLSQSKIFTVTRFFCVS